MFRKYVGHLITLMCLLVGTRSVTGAELVAFEFPMISNARAAFVDSVESGKTQVVVLSPVGYFDTKDFRAKERPTAFPGYRSGRESQPAHIEGVMIPPRVRERVSPGAEAIVGIDLLGTGRFIPGMPVREIRRLSCDDASRDWENVLTGYAPAGPIRAATPYPYSIAFPDYHIAPGSFRGSEGYVLSVMEEVNPSAAGREGVLVPQVYFLSGKFAPYWGQGKNMLFFERLRGNPYLFEWESPKRVAALVQTLRNTVCMITRDGEVALYDHVEGWSAARKILNGRVCGLHRERDVYRLYFSRDSRLSSVRTKDFIDVSEERYEDLTISDSSTVIVESNPTARWCVAISGKEKDVQRLFVAHSYGDEAWSSWQEFGELKSGEFQVSALSIGDTPAVYVSATSWENSTARVFRISLEQTRTPNGE
jgi:hypothetical protein